MAFTTFLRNELLDHAFRNAAYTPPSTVYIGLYTSATGAGGTGTEVSGNGYTRKAMAFDAASSGAIDNTICSRVSNGYRLVGEPCDAYGSFRRGIKWQYAC